jgi:argininosuccinate lyase
MMRDAAEDGYSTATELADWLVRSLNLPFRDAHHVTGKIVKLAETKGVRLIDLPLTEMQAIESRITQDVYACLTPEAALRARGII